MEKKKQVGERFSAILKSYGVKSKLSAEDSQYIFELLGLCCKLNYIKYPEYYLYVSNYKLPTGRYVKMIYACNGSRKIPISKSKIMDELFPVKSKLTDVDKHINMVKQAARNIIEPQIREFRSSINLPVICPLSYKTLSNWSLVHIDHQVPFSKLFENWLEINNLFPGDISLSGPKNNKTFKSESLRDSWYLYHLNNAVLQCVDSKFNLYKSNK